MSSTLNPIAICNQALSWLGANQITAFDEDSPEAKYCTANYEPLRDAVLEDHPWSFALRRRRIGASVADPNGDYLPNKAFRIPDQDGVLRVLQAVTDPEFKDTDNLYWEYEGGLILCKADTIWARYIYRVVDPALFSPNFANTFAARIAAELALPITESGTKANVLMQQYQIKLANALNTDSLQGRNPRLRSTWMQRSRAGTRGV